MQSKPVQFLRREWKQFKTCQGYIKKAMVVGCMLGEKGPVEKQCHLDPTER